MQHTVENHLHDLPRMLKRDLREELLQRDRKTAENACDNKILGGKERVLGLDEF